MEEFFPLLVALIVGHYLADYPLQGDFLAQAKQRILEPDGVGAHALAAHSVIQGGTAAVAGLWITGTWPVFFFTVMVTHWIIDFGKIANFYGFRVDQWLHLTVLVALAAGVTVWG